ncbi:hypothetical protein IQ7_09401 [Streptococcus thermophilus MTCC 5461]|nr:hypothetical protein IQ7_09401 [Streptococcus thermophilus MTCC 5461]
MEDKETKQRILQFFGKRRAPHNFTTCLLMSKLDHYIYPEVYFFLTLKKPAPFPKSYVNYDRIE